MSGPGYARRQGVQASLAGINAAVVGFVGAALYNPVWVTAVRGVADAAIAIVALALLERWRAPPIVAVLACVALSFVRVLF